MPTASILAHSVHERFPIAAESGEVSRGHGVLFTVWLPETMVELT